MRISVIGLNKLVIITCTALDVIMIMHFISWNNWEKIFIAGSGLHQILREKNKETLKDKFYIRPLDGARRLFTEPDSPV